MNTPRQENVDTVRIETLLVTPEYSIHIGATGMDALIQNIRIIVTTLSGSVPLDRAFASTGSFIDAPTPHAVALRIAELTELIEAREPRVKVCSIAFRAFEAVATSAESMTTGGATSLSTGSLTRGAMEAIQGRIFPCITFTLQPGVEL